MKDFYHFNLLAYNTFGMNVHCKRFLEFDSEAELQQCLSIVAANKEPLLLLGGGSNLLLTADYPGIVLHSHILGVEAQNCGDELLVRCGSGENWDDLVARFVANGWHGAENLSFIPGEVGASAVQNIGAYGVEVKDLIVEVEALEVATGEKKRFTNADLRYAYRYSRLKDDWKNHYAITYVTYRLSRTFRPLLDYGNIRSALEKKGIIEPNAQQLRDIIIDIRNEKLPNPKEQGNAGSFFMNPIVAREVFDTLAEQYPTMPHYLLADGQVKIPAGWMIEQCGWKGKSLGQAGVHDRQALVLVNRGGATGQEIVELCRQIQNDVKERFQINIYPEVNIL